MLKKERLKYLHKKSINNRSKNKESKVLGCFHCGEVISPKEVTDYIQDDKKTDICPNCGVDSLVSFDEILRELNEEYMGFGGKLVVDVSKELR